MCPNALDQTERLERLLPLVVPRHIISGKTERTDTRAEAALQPSFSQVVEHGDFFGDPDRIPERQHINQWTQTDSSSSLGGGTEKTAWARALRESHVKVVFGDKIEIDTCLIGEFDDVEMIFVEINIGTSRIVVFLHVVKEAELHFEPTCSALFLSGFLAA